MKARLITILAVILTATTTLAAVFWFAGETRANVYAADLPGLNNASTITIIQPNSAPNDLDTLVVISGTDFTAGMSGTQVITPPMVYLDATELAQVIWVDTTTLSATVPWGLDPGIYTLTVQNPDGETGSLTNAFTVTQGIGVWNAGELYGGEVQQLVVNPVTPTTLYASTHGGLFRSRDGGESWSFKLSPTADYPAIDPLSPNRIYVYSYPHHPNQFLFRSDDEGETWIPLTTTFPITYTTGYDCWGGFGILPHPTISGTVYVHACDNGEGKSGLIVSTNWGQDWEPTINGLTDTQVTALAFHPDNPDIMYLGTAGGNIFNSSDGGDSWTFASRPLEYVRILAVNPFGDHEVWATSCDGYGAPCALLKSTNADLTTWMTMEPVPGEPMCAENIEFASTISGTVFIASGHGYQTTDGGATWAPFGPDVSIHDIALHPTEAGTIYLAGFLYGVHKTTDGGATWQVVNQGLTAMFPEQLVTVPGQPEVVYARVRFQPGVFKSTRGGATWQFSQVEPNVSSLLVDPLDPTRVYAGVGDGVYVSTDGGGTWPTFGELAPPPQYIDCGQFPNALLAIPGQPGTLLAGVQHWCGLPMACPGSIYRSTDYGEHWDRVYPTHTQEISQVNDLAYDPGSPTVIYAATGELGRGGGIFKSTDGGVTWEPVGAGQIDYAQDIVVEPGTHRVFASQRLLPLYVSNDGGATWAPTGFGGGHNVSEILFAPGNPPVLYDAALQGLYRSIDGAQSWQPVEGVLGQIPVYSIASIATDDRVILYAGTTGGIVETSAIQHWDQAKTSGTLVNAGVYRYTMLSYRLYLPAIPK